MNTAKHIAILIGGIVLVVTALGAAQAEPGGTWLATGTVTRIDGSTFYFLGKDNVIYEINAIDSEVIVDEFSTDCYSLRVGDTVRVYGRQTDQGGIRAIRVRILDRYQEHAGARRAGEEPEKEIKIIIEKREAQGAQQDGGVQAQPPRPGWNARGLITGIDYTSRRVKVQNSCGNYSVDVSNAVLTNGRYRIGFGRLNLGDAVRVTGSLGGANEVTATRLDVSRTRSEAENAVPLIPISVAGTILQVDYASRTFKMGGQIPLIVVAADDSTRIFQDYDNVSFSFLRPGMRVKMSGNGSIMTGYSARQIQIIGIAP